MKLKALALFLLLGTFCPVLFASDSRWSTTINYAQYKPDLVGWDQGYDDNYMRGWQTALAYKPFSILELGLGVGYFSASGVGLLPLNGSLGGEVRYLIYPVEAYIELQAKFSQNQWLVPYIGGGYNMLYYRLEIDGQDNRKGKAEGTQYELGVRLLLNAFDSSAAKQLEQAWGIESTQLVLEVKNLDVNKLDLALGGKVYSLGLVFEF